MGRWVGRAPVAGVVVYLVGLVGCHAVPKANRAGELPVGHGMAHRAVPGEMGPVLRATMVALDEQGVGPQQLLIRSLTAGTDQPGAIGIEPEASNSAMVPSGSKFAELFVHHQVTKPDGSAAPFVPRFVTYTGGTADGRAVRISIATHREDAANNLVSVSVGATDDAAWCQTLLDKVSAGVGGGSGQPADAHESPNPTLPN